ncbi:glycoside hydrolase family protein [Synechococcus lacustris Tous-12m]
MLTIGIGSTGPHVYEGMTITEAEAEALLLKDLVRFEKAVNELVNSAPMPRRL